VFSLLKSVVWLTHQLDLVGLEPDAYIRASITWPNNPGPSLSIERARSENSPIIENLSSHFGCSNV
jgi:hypothetical protein